MNVRTLLGIRSRSSSSPCLKRLFGMTEPVDVGSASRFIVPETQIANSSVKVMPSKLKCQKRLQRLGYLAGRLPSGQNERLFSPFISRKMLMPCARTSVCRVGATEPITAAIAVKLDSTGE
jgi:hypothetical protein